MTDLVSSPGPPIARAKSVPSQPTFFAGLRAVWLFTWKTRLSWRRLPTLVVSLLILPLLVYLTTSSPQAWAQRHPLLGNPAADVNEFANRLARSDLQLTREQNAQLRRIFAEEYARAEEASRDNQPAETSIKQQNEQVRVCSERIQNRAETVLEAGQFALLLRFEKRKLLETQIRVNQPLWNRTGPFYHWLIDFYFFVILPLICVGACGPLIREELQADTLGFLTTRPLTRARLLVIKYLSQTAWLQLVLLAETVLLFTAGDLRQIPALSGLLPLFLAAQILAVLAWCALGTLLGLMVKRYMALALVYGFIVEMGIGRIPTNINTLSLMRHLKTLLAHNLALEAIYRWPGSGVPGSVGALALAACLFLTLAAMLFTFKEYHHTAEMQK